MASSVTLHKRVSTHVNASTSHSVFSSTQRVFLSHAGVPVSHSVICGQRAETMSLWASRSGLVRECHRCSQARAVLVPASLFSELMKRQVPSADVAAPAHSETPSKRQRRLVVSHAGPAERLKTPPTRSSEGDSGDGIWFIVGLGNPGPRYESTR